MAKIGVNRPGGQPTVLGSMNNRLRTVGDISCCKDSWSASGQGLWVDQQTSPRSNANAGTFGQEGRIRRLTDCDKYDINRDVEFGTKHRDRLAASLFIWFAQSHTLAAHAFDMSFRREYLHRCNEFMQLNTLGNCRAYFRSEERRVGKACSDMWVTHLAKTDR